MATSIKEMKMVELMPVNRPSAIIDPAAISLKAASRACVSGHFIPMDLNQLDVPASPDGENTLFHP